MKKALIIFAVLAGLVLAGLVALSFYTSNQVEQSLRQALQANAGEYEVQFESATVNTVNSSIRINDLRMYDRNTRSQVNIGVVSFQVPHLELIKASRAPRAAMLEHIEMSTMNFRNAIFFNEDAGANILIRNGTIEVDGVLGDFIRSVTHLQAPDRPQRLHLRINGIELTREGPSTGYRNAITVLESLSGEMVYSVSSRKAEFSDFRISSLGANTDIRGYLLFGDVSEITGKEDIEVHTTLTSRTSRGRVDIGENDAGIDFRRMVLTVTGTIPADRDFEKLAKKNDLLVELQADQLQIYMPASFRQGTGRTLGMLGASSDSFLIPEVKGIFRFMDERFHVDQLTFNTPFADITGSGKLYVNRENLIASSWEDTAIIIKPQSRENLQFINSFAGFMGLRLPQVGDGFRIPVRGTLESPELGLN